MTQTVLTSDVRPPSWTAFRLVLVARDANEGDTRLLVTDFLCDGLGFDKYADLTTEYQVKGEFADYGIRIDRDLVAFIEVERVATKLSTKHLRQVDRIDTRNRQAPHRDPTSSRWTSAAALERKSHA
jgi:hypothetical protein